MRLTRRRFITTSGALLGVPSFQRASQMPQASAPERQTLFSGGEGDYALYRIPGIVVTRRGSVLAYCEGRRESHSDWGTIDLLLRRSTDNGRRWDLARRIAAVDGPVTRNPVAVERKQGRPDDVTYNNPIAIADRKTGAVHFVFCLEYGRAFYQRSDDDGITFSRPVEITSAFEALRSRYHWRVIATGPGHGIQLANGRLLVPVWLSLGLTGNGHAPSVVSVIFSDDHGHTWQAGEIIGLDSPDLINPSETVAVQLNDGRTMLNLRNTSKSNRRAITFSRDGATGWSPPVFDDQLPEPICMGSIIRFSSKPSRILFANPDNLTRADGRETPGAGRDRRNLSVRLSLDEGRTWPIIKSLEPGASGYSDLAIARDRSILCFYESHSPQRPEAASAQLVLARFGLNWLINGKDQPGR